MAKQVCWHPVDGKNGRMKRCGAPARLRVVHWADGRPDVTFIECDEHAVTDSPGVYTVTTGD